MQAGDCQWLLGHVQAGGSCAGCCHRFGQDAATTTDIENLAAVEIRELSNPVEPQRVYLMEWPKFSVRIPPARRQRIKLGDFGCIDVVPGRCHSSCILGSQ